MKQHRLSDLMPGSAGGRALAAQRGASYLQSIAALGGAATVDRHGRSYMQQIGRAGRAAQLRRQLSPRVICYDGAPVMIIPWFPPREHPRYHRRRRRPILVWVWS
jgi:hypothetical protein